MDGGFLSVIEIGQYFMTKDTGEQFYAVACREYTLPRDDGSSQPRGWIQGNTKIGPVLEQLNVKDFAYRSKANAKPQRREPAGSSPSIIPMNARNSIDIEPGKHSLSEDEVSKKVISSIFIILSRCNEKRMERFISGEIKENLQSQLIPTDSLLV